MLNLKKPQNNPTFQAWVFRRNLRLHASNYSSQEEERHFLNREVFMCSKLQVSFWTLSKYKENSEPKKK